ncbi:hypothetical protein BY458DRAFT_489567 [Sporodiniella umbellata]|nr:hypothetical protein BY458DRAFT_489567 [Sporodiniella umbellata]
MNFESLFYPLLPFFRKPKKTNQSLCTVNQEPTKKTLDGPAECLPPYTCSINKIGVYNVKLETNAKGKKAWSRPWKQVYFELRGTMFKLYEVRKRSSRYYYTPSLAFYQQYEYVPLWTLSLVDLEISWAKEYKKKPNVLRLKWGQYQCLMEIQTKADLYSWIEKIMAAKRIAVDIDA